MRAQIDWIAYPVACHAWLAFSMAGRSLQYQPRNTSCVRYVPYGPASAAFVLVTALWGKVCKTATSERFRCPVDPG